MSSIKCCKNASSSFESSNSNHSTESSSFESGRSWKKWAKIGGEILVGVLVVAFAVVSVAALVIGIIALVNPAALGTAGAAISAGVIAGCAIAAENAVPILVVGCIGTALLAIATIASLTECLW